MEWLSMVRDSGKLCLLTTCREDANGVSNRNVISRVSASNAITIVQNKCYCWKAIVKGKPESQIRSCCCRDASIHRHVSRAYSLESRMPNSGTSKCNRGREEAVSGTIRMHSYRESGKSGF
jgi:hypothetical protein